MSQYYLAAQLPSLDAVSDAVPLPITEEKFYELCSRFLSKRSFDILKNLTISPKRDIEPTGSVLVDAWNEGERNLRLALGIVRAGKLKKSFDASSDNIPQGLLLSAKTALEAPDPFQAEKLLNKERLKFLESLRPMDSFSEDAVFYYGLKLKLLSYIRQFDSDKGKEAYQKIYNTIMVGGSREVK